MPSKSFCLQPLEKLLDEEDPLEIAWLLDELMLILVHYGELSGQRYIHLSDYYHLAREVRNAFFACGEITLPKATKSKGYGNR